MISVFRGFESNKKERIGGAKQRGVYENRLGWGGVLYYSDKQETNQPGKQGRERQEPSHAAQ